MSTPVVSEPQHDRESLRALDSDPVTGPSTDTDHETPEPLWTVFHSGSAASPNPTSTQ